MTSRPVIGITAALEPAGWAVWNGIDANVSQRTYSLNVADAGAIPILLPADEASTGSPDELLRVLDGLLVAGGADLDPASYGTEPEPSTAGYNAERDRFELALTRRALELELPVLAVCRGLEILNVACRGTIQQDVANRELHLETPGRFSEHLVRLERGSLAARVAGAEQLSVHSHHHQGIDRLGDGLIATGWSEPDGLIEAIEHPGHEFVLGLLWHPEEHRRSPVIGALAEAARAKVAA